MAPETRQHRQEQRRQRRLQRENRRQQREYRRQLRQRRRDLRRQMRNDLLGQGNGVPGARSGSTAVPEPTAPAQTFSFGSTASQSQPAQCPTLQTSFGQTAAPTPGQGFPTFHFGKTPAPTQTQGSRTFQFGSQTQSYNNGPAGQRANPVGSSSSSLPFSMGAHGMSFPGFTMGPNGMTFGGNGSGSGMTMEPNGISFGGGTGVPKSPLENLFPFGSGNTGSPGLTSLFGTQSSAAAGPPPPLVVGSIGRAHFTPTTPVAPSPPTLPTFGRPNIASFHRGNRIFVNSNTTSGTPTPPTSSPPIVAGGNTIVYNGTSAVVNGRPINLDNQNGTPSTFVGGNWISINDESNAQNQNDHGQRTDNGDGDGEGTGNEEKKEGNETSDSKK